MLTYIMARAMEPEPGAQPILDDWSQKFLDSGAGDGA